MQAAGINAASITYDSRDTLKAFSDANQIKFPMLSDVGSKVIQAFGIFNTNIPPDHPMLYGIPFPGDFLIAPDGTVREKHFLPSYEHRASATIVLHDASPTNSTRIETDAFAATVAFSTDRCFPGQELGVTLTLTPKPGWHIYGKPLPASYQSLELEFDGPLVDQQSLDLPPATPLHFPALDETLPAYAAELRASGKLGIRWSPPMPAKFLAGLGEKIEPGTHQVTGTLKYQACRDELCEPPQAIRFELPITILAGVPPAPKSS